MVNRLRQRIEASSRRDIILTAAPQCPLAAQWFQMKTIIHESKFDKIWIQFYNNPNCDASSDLTFNFDAWTLMLAATRSSGAEVFIGLPGSESAAGSGYIGRQRARDIICKAKKSDKFAGVMLWDAYFAANNVENGKTYYDSIAEILKCGCPGEVCTKPTTTSSTALPTSSTTTSSNIVSRTSSSTALSITSSTTLPTSSTTTSSGIVSRTSSTYSSTSSTTTKSSQTSTTSIPTISESITTSSSIPTLTTRTSSSTRWSNSTITTSSTSWTSSTTSVVPSSTTCEDDESSTSSSGLPSSTSTTSTLTSPTMPPATTTSYTESTVMTTVTYTVISCAASVTDCPGKGAMVTETIPLYTTICPVTETSVDTPVPTTTTAPEVSLTTSTVYSTRTATVTKCPPTVTDCPIGSVTTEVVAVSTTVCPVTETETGTADLTPTPIITTDFKAETTGIPATKYPVQSPPVAKPSPSTAITVPLYPTGSFNGTVPTAIGTGSMTVVPVPTTTKSDSDSAESPAPCSGAAKNSAFSLGGLLLAAALAL